MPDQLDRSAAVIPVLSPLKALGALLFVVLLMIGYVSLTMIAGTRALFAGFAFSLLWGAVYKLSLKELPAVLGGSLFGIALCYFYQQTPIIAPHYASIIFLPVILATIYCFLLGWAPLIINNSAMLFLIIGTIPEVQTHERFLEVAGAVLMAAAYFGTLACLLTRIKTRSLKSQQI